MLDPKFQNLCLMSFSIGCEQGVAIVEEYEVSTSYVLEMLFSFTSSA
jgi:hypothetical protein